MMSALWKEGHRWTFNSRWNDIDSTMIEYSIC